MEVDTPLRFAIQKATALAEKESQRCLGPEDATKSSAIKRMMKRSKGANLAEIIETDRNGSGTGSQF